MGFGIDVVAIAGISSFFGWAFNPVGPDDAARKCVEVNPPIKVPELNGLLFQAMPSHPNTPNAPQDRQECHPTIALYCGAKVRPESYALLAQEILACQSSTQSSNNMANTNDTNGNNDNVSIGGVLVLQSPFNIYAFKPASVQKVLQRYPSIRCIAGHSIGGLWAAEFCRDYFQSENYNNESKQPSQQLDFVHLGVHGGSLSLAPFRKLPFRNVGYVYATKDGTLHRAMEKKGQSLNEYISHVEREELPKSAKVFQIEGGNHSQYGCYGMPGRRQGLAYDDLEADISSEEQRKMLAKAIAETMV